MSYNHLSLVEIHYIQVERKWGKSSSKIACELGRSPSTISREIKRNTELCGYRHQQADCLALERHQNKAKSGKTLFGKNNSLFRFQVFVGEKEQDCFANQLDKDRPRYFRELRGRFFLGNCTVLAKFYCFC